MDWIFHQLHPLFTLEFWFQLIVITVGIKYYFVRKAANIAEKEVVTMSERFKRLRTIFAHYWNEHPSQDVLNCNNKSCTSF